MNTHNLCFLSSNKKNNVYPCEPQFYYIKVGLWASKLYRYDFVMKPAITRIHTNSVLEASSLQRKRF